MEEASQKAERLVWPPTKADLERLYLRERLSAMKIAKRYELKYPSEKTAESTILYHLKRNRITRRDCAEHVRKVTASMVDEWVARYQSGESLKQIAGDLVDPVTVFVHLHKRGLQLRDKVEAQIKAVTRYSKRSFDGDEADAAYLLGFARGDLNVKRHRRAVRIRTSSTHPAMIELVAHLFVPYGPIRIYPRLSKLAGFEWSIEGELDKTFEFLLQEKPTAPGKTASRRVLLAYLAGVFDAEGSVWLRSDNEYQPAVSFTNTDVSLMNWIREFLTSLGFYAWLGQPNRDGVYQIQMWRVGEVLDLLRLLPSKHPERKAKIKILLDSSKSWPEYRQAWDALVESIGYDKKEFAQLASRELAARST